MNKQTNFAISLIKNSKQKISSDVMNIACREGNIDIVKLLLDLEITNEAMDLAITEGHIDIVKLLLLHKKPFGNMAYSYADLIDDKEMYNLLDSNIDLMIADGQPVIEN